MTPQQPGVTPNNHNDQPIPLFPRVESNELFEWIEAPPNPLQSLNPQYIFFHSLEIPWRSFKLLNASDQSRDSRQIELLRGICGDAESDYRNCSEACSSTSDMFSSGGMVQHCLTLASLSLAAVSFPGLNESSRGLISDALRHFSIKDAAEFPGELILNRTFECAMVSCATDPGECQMKDLNASYIVDGRVYWNVLSEPLVDICEGIQANVNNDVAGPGVSVFSHLRASRLTSG